MTTVVHGAPERENVVPEGTERSALSPKEARRLRVAESLLVGNPGNSARLLLEALDRRVETPIELDLDSVRGFDGNPRRRLNPKFVEIKASIREVGIQTPLAVTRRPDQTHYILESGGNTRLRALRELWEETRDPRFRRVVAVYRPWKSERHLIGAHLVENELRGDLSFWDKAVGMDALKQAIEVEEARALSLRELVAEFSRIGLTVGHGTISYCMFAVERLRVLGERIPGFSGLDVRHLQPRLNVLKRHAWGRAGMAEDALYEHVFDPVFAEVAEGCVQGSAFSVADLHVHCEEALARVLGHPVRSLRSLSGEESSEEEARTHATAPAIEDEAVASFAGDDALAPVASVRRSAASQDDAIGRLRQGLIAFAAASGIACCLDVHDGDGWRVRLLPLSEEFGRGSAQALAWHLIALLLGANADRAQSWAVDAAFVRWLIDSDDAGSSAWWDILTLLRDSGDLRSVATNSWEVSP